MSQSVACLLELSTNIREVSQYTEKGPIRAVSLHFHNQESIKTLY